MCVCVCVCTRARACGPGMFVIFSYHLIYATWDCWEDNPSVQAGSFVIQIEALFQRNAQQNLMIDHSDRRKRHLHLV